MTRNGPGTLREFKEVAERAFLVDKLREHNWNISKTAEVIGTPRSNLYKKLEQYGITQESTDSRLGRIPHSAFGFACQLRSSTAAVRPDDRRRAERLARAKAGRKVRTPQGSAPGNARSGRPEGQWHRKHTAAVGARSAAGKGEKVR